MEVCTTNDRLCLDPLDQRIPANTFTLTKMGQAHENADRWSEILSAQNSHTERSLHEY